MKRILIVFGVLAVLTATLSSCAATNRDCQGVKHTRLKNGIYL
jgi:hypothetical protein